MNVHPSDRSSPVSLLRDAMWFALSISCLFYAGCFLPRDQRAWSDPNKSSGRYAVLPVLYEQVRITVEGSKVVDSYEISMADSNVKNQEEVARVINEVLDTIASGERNALEGPSEFGSTLKQSSQWKYFQVYIKDPGPLNEPWKQEGLAKISGELGYHRVLCVNPTLRFKPNLSFRVEENDPFGQHWDGRIKVKIDMMDIASAKVIATGTGDADFYGDMGAWVFGGYGGAIIIPYAFGKAFDRAVDQAIRQALAELFTIMSKGGAGK